MLHFIDKSVVVLGEDAFSSLTSIGHALNGLLSTAVLVPVKKGVRSWVLRIHVQIGRVFTRIKTFVIEVRNFCVLNSQDLTNIEVHEAALAAPKCDLNRNCVFINYSDVSSVSALACSCHDVTQRRNIEYDSNGINSCSLHEILNLF